MGLGRIRFAVVAVCAIALAVSGCGGGDSATNADSTATVATDGATPATGKTDKKSKSSKEKSSKKSDSSSAASPGLKTDSSGGSASADAGSEQIGPKPVDLSSGDKKAVSSAFNKLISALDSKNVAYLCGSAYSKQFLAQLEKQGGCVKATTKQLSPISGYSASISSVSGVPGTNLVAVSAKLKPETSDGQKTNEGSIYFVKQSGSWKRAVPPSAN